MDWQHHEMRLVVCCLQLPKKEGYPAIPFLESTHLGVKVTLEECQSFDLRGIYPKWRVLRNTKPGMEKSFGWSVVGVSQVWEKTNESTRNNETIRYEHHDDMTTAAVIPRSPKSFHPVFRRFLLLNVYSTRYYFFFIHCWLWKPICTLIIESKDLI